MGNKQYKANSYTDFFYYAFRNILLVSVPLPIISALILSIPHSSADNSNTSTDTFTLTLDVSCTINSTVLEPHNIHLEGSGLHRENIGATKIGVYCNDNNGYNIYAIGSSNNADGNTDLVADSSLSSEYNIKTGIYDGSAASLYSSSWSMKLTAGVGTGIDPITGNNIQTSPPTIDNGYNNYNVVPNVYTLVASRPSGTNMNSSINTDITGSYFTTTYDIYASSVQPAGTYTGKVKYILTHPNTNAPNTINDIDAAFAMAGKQKAYQDSEGSYYAMQDMTGDICNSVIGTGASTTARLIDTRDHNIYYVTKLKDNHCWMTQNLDLDINGQNTSPLTSENTDISTTASGSGIYDATKGYTESNGVWTWNPGTTTSNVLVNYSTNRAEGWVNNNAAPMSAEGGDTYLYTPDNGGNETRFDSLEACMGNNQRTEAECKHYHVGNYYNWTAAIASNNSNGFSTQYNNAANSICPKGWRLPIATNEDQSIYEFGDMLFKQGITTQTVGNPVSYAANGLNNIRKSPLWFVRAGWLNGGALGHLGYAGYYWSSTVVNVNNSYILYFDGSGVNSSLSYDRLSGRLVRCIAR